MNNDSQSYLDEKELIRRIRVLQQDADGGLLEEFKGVMAEAIDAGVEPATIASQLVALGFKNTAELFHKWRAEYEKGGENE